ncbi:MAG: polysaccharide biosynthesis tyrosine autokinase [Planctomycetes bacterium]|nr:polysaccharide biosynthesis tyrosine autokinase [Planctomycetota bacterium]
MGRIADALKRAEEERCRNLGTSAPTSGAPKPSSVFRPMNAALETASRSERREIKDLEEESLRVVEGLSESLVPFFERSSLVTEQYRSLRTRLLSQNPNYEHRIIAITSAVPKEGKSVTTLNLGCILAEIRHLKVLVADGDFRRSSLAHMLNRPANPGLAEVISGEATYEEALHPTPIPNLTLIPAGNSKGRSAAELLTATGALPAFRRMQNDFHYTIVDTPPATTVTDVGIIGQMCTGVIVVIRLHQTHEGVARRAVRLLQANNIPIMGCLLVGRDAPGTHYGYGYGYGYGYRYNYYRYYDNTKQDQEEA